MNKRITPAVIIKAASVVERTIQEQVDNNEGWRKWFFSNNRQDDSGAMKHPLSSDALWLKKAQAQVLKGGIADKKQDSDFDPKSVRKGMKVESEHTSNNRMQKEIAQDHLTEDKRYYQKLEKMEKKAVIEGIDPLYMKAFSDITVPYITARLGARAKSTGKLSAGMKKITEGIANYTKEFEASTGKPLTGAQSVRNIVNEDLPKVPALRKKMFGKGDPYLKELGAYSTVAPLDPAIPLAVGAFPIVKAVAAAEGGTALGSAFLKRTIPKRIEELKHVSL